ncbi:hypothetical protein [Chromobacterium sp. Rain0013]|uniref:hypothetical protein n=1 Tax=Chromobacterium sp. Rain0013 TaxID=2292447 RepID=UPI001887F120|nr:hypothetical protein [Chromobacterium sp. Rain0013]
MKTPRRMTSRGVFAPGARPGDQLLGGGSRFVFSFLSRMFVSGFLVVRGARSMLLVVLFAGLLVFGFMLHFLFCGGRGRRGGGHGASGESSGDQSGNQFHDMSFLV